MGDSVLTEILARRDRGVLPDRFKDFFKVLMDKFKEAREGVHRFCFPECDVHQWRDGLRAYKVRFFGYCDFLNFFFGGKRRPGMVLFVFQPAHCPDRVEELVAGTLGLLPHVQDPGGVGGRGAEAAGSSCYTKVPVF